MRTASGACTAIRCASSTARIREMQRLIAGAPVLLETLDAESKAALRVAVRPPAQAPASSIMSSRDWCAGWITTRARCSNGPPMRSARKARSAPAAATMAWWRQLGGPGTPGIGWAMGQERIVMLLEKQGLVPARDRPQVYLVLVGDRTEAAGLPTGGAVARRVAGSQVASQSGRRQFQDAIQARRQERRAVCTRFGGRRSGPRGRRAEGLAPGIGAGGMPG